MSKSSIERILAILRVQERNSRSITVREKNEVKKKKKVAEVTEIKNYNREVNTKFKLHNKKRS